MNDEDLMRYSRHILLPQIDLEGQDKICNSHVMIVGLGGLGSPVAMYLAGAGVGEMTLVDHDLVELSNLQRQIIHTCSSLGQTKVESAQRAVLSINPKIKVHACTVEASVGWLIDRVSAVDVVVDCSDNVAVRYALNDACLQNKTPWVSGAAIEFSGQVIVFDPRNAQSPCYACLYPTPRDHDETCASNGVLSPLVGMIGSLQAIEVLRLLVGFGSDRVGKLSMWNAFSGSEHTITLAKDDKCDKCMI